jgi:hypothetical protein
MLVLLRSFLKFRIIPKGAIIVSPCNATASTKPLLRTSSHLSSGFNITLTTALLVLSQTYCRITKIKLQIHMLVESIFNHHGAKELQMLHVTHPYIAIKNTVSLAEGLREICIVC